MDTIPVISSSSFNWIGFTGFSDVSTVEGQVERLHLFEEHPFAVRSAKTERIVQFHHRITNKDVYTDIATSFVYEGHTPAGNLMTLLIYNN